MDNSTTMGICDLPEEILGIIFDYLTVSEFKNASLVCLQWLHLIFSGRRLDRVRFYVGYNDVKHAAINVLRETQRRYRHIRFSASDRDTCEKFVPILHRFESFLVSLKLDSCNEVSLIKRILLEVPNLKALSLLDLEAMEERSHGHGFLQLPELKQLSLMKICFYSSTLLTAIDFRTIAPNLQRIEMVCDTESDLNVYRHFSDQLKSVVVFLKNDECMHSFCEIVFPKLLEIKVCVINFVGFILNANCGFIAGAKHLQRATLEPWITQPFINSLVEHCREITFLSIRTDKLKNRSLLGLANLKHLNTLVLDGMTTHYVFDECKPIPSLQALHVPYLDGIKDQLMFFKGLCTAAPYLTKLCLEDYFGDRCLEFICNNLLSLKCLKLSHNQSRRISGLEYLDRLPHLFKLSLKGLYPKRQHVTDGWLKGIPPLKISVLSIHTTYAQTFLYQWTIDDFLLIPQLFSSLKMLKISGHGNNLHECIKTLRFLLPSCTILERY